MRARAKIDKPLLATDLPEFLWGGWDDGFLFSVHRTKVRKELPMAKADALAHLSEGWPFFGVCPRVSNGGQGKKHCSTLCDVIWCEVDLILNGPVCEDDALEAAVSRLEKARLTIYPSAFTYSGNRSPHLYFKLDERLPVAEIEYWNRFLARRLDSDPAVINIDRIMRHPGSSHETTGRQATLLELSREISSVAALEKLRPATEERTDRRDYRKPQLAPRGTGQWLDAAEKLGDWYERKDFDASAVLTDGNHRGYISAMPSRGWSDPRFPSRSEAEQGIVATLVRHGASDRQIWAFADDHFAKHIEKLRAGDAAYLQRMIDGARERLYEEYGKISHPVGGSPRKREAKYRHTPTASYQAALDLVRGQPASEWVKEIQSEGIAKQSTAYLIRRRLQTECLIEIGSDGCVRTPPVR
jgi:hypothetical protein